MTELVFGMTHALNEAHVRGHGNMTISARMVIECAELIEQQAKEIEALRSVSTEMARKGMAIRMELEAAQKRIAELEADCDHLMQLIRDVFIELDDSDNSGPGHDHKIPGIWDKRDTSDVAGKPCEWCRLWDLVRIEAVK